jgi:hypothetical protein
MWTVPMYEIVNSECGQFQSMKKKRRIMKKLNLQTVIEKCLLSLNLKKKITATFAKIRCKKAPNICTMSVRL